MSPPTRSTAVLVLVGTILLYLGPLALDAPLTDPDEGLHAAIAQEMSERGDLVVPRFLGTPFLDKPVLYFWAQAGSMSAFGMSTAAARLPGMLFAILGVVTTGWLARTLFAPAAFWIAASCYATMVLPFLLAQAPVHDMALVPFTNLALALLWKASTADAAHDSGRSSAPLWLGAGLALGLAILTKGFEGVAIVGIAVAGFLLLARRLTWPLVWKGSAVVALAAAVASPWFIAMEARAPNYLYYYFVARHLLGFATDTQRHGGQPWWFYVPLVVGGGLPWLLYVRLPSWRRPQSAHEPPSPTILLWTWLVGALTVLSLSGSKAVTYILPAMPAVALLATQTWMRGPAMRSAATVSESLHRRALVHAGLFFAIALAAPWAGSRFANRDVTAAEIVAFGFLGLWWAWVMVMLWRRSSQWTWPGLVAGTTATYAIAFALLGPRLADAHSARDLAEYFDRSAHLPETIYVMDQRVSFVYYLNPEVRRRLGADSVRSISLEEVAAMDPFPRGAVLALPWDLAARLLRAPQLASAPRRGAGRYVVVGPGLLPDAAPGGLSQSQ